MVEAPLKAGAEVDAKDMRGMTPLHWAAHEKVVEALVARSGPTAKSPLGRTPLTWAAYNGHEQAVEALLKAGADIDAKDSYIMTPLHWAATEGHEKVVEAPLKAGAEVDAKTPHGLDVGSGIGQPTMAMRRWLKRPLRPEPRSMPRTCVE